MEKAKNKIIVTDEIIDQTLDFIEGLDDKEYEKLVNRFIDEQIGLMQFASMIKEDFSKKFFDTFFDMIVIIWYAFEIAAGKVPEITDAIFEKVSNKDVEDEQFKKLSKLLNITDENLLHEKLDDFNKVMSKVTNEEEYLKTKASLGKEYQIIAEVLLEYMTKVSQPDLYSFLMDEALTAEISTKKKPGQEDVLAAELTFVMDCFDEAVNFKPKLKISKA